jgi:hypothetical protein
MTFDLQVIQEHSYSERMLIIHAIFLNDSTGLEILTPAVQVDQEAPKVLLCTPMIMY